jgi:hypothetical protein
MRRWDSHYKDIDRRVVKLKNQTTNEGQAAYNLIKEKTMTDVILGTIYMIVMIAFIYHVFSGNVNR